jgi:hypothetical protein
MEYAVDTPNRLSAMFWTGYQRCLKDLSTGHPHQPAIGDVFAGYQRCLVPAISDVVYRLSQMETTCKASNRAGFGSLNTRARFNGFYLTL